MAEFPRVEVELHRRVKALGAQVRLKHRKRGRRFLVDDGAVVQRRQAVAVALDGLIGAKSRREQVAQLVDPLVLEVVDIKTLGEIVVPHEEIQAFVLPVLRQDVARFVERVDAFVHPCIFTLVAAQDAVKPVVAHLVDDDRLEA